MKLVPRRWLVALSISVVVSFACSSSPNAGSGGSAGTAGLPEDGASGGPLGNSGGRGDNPATAGSSDTAGNPGSGGGDVAAGGGSTASGGSEQYEKPAQPPPDEDGSELWLRYRTVALPARLAEYQAALKQVILAGSGATLQAAQDELVKGLSGLTGTAVGTSAEPTSDGAVVLGTPASSALVKALPLSSQLATVGPEGYLVQATEVLGKQAIVIAANTDLGVLHGTFAFLRHLQCHRVLTGLALSGAPKISRRLLNHWDNLDGSIERGYAGKSLWNWGALPATLSPRYQAYARANASLGINGAVLNNVNADAKILTSAYLDKVAALATAFRPYGIAVYLSASFSAPIQIGGLTTADPQASAVKAWWLAKADEIYQKIPDFGGFVVKANSEGQPGPKDYNRTHADGAQVLADALAPHGGIVLWRAFVYADSGDRIRQAYDEFKPLDGKFASNAMIQVKNGALDFQPREPFHPLFGGMASTPVALELQITKEYLGEDSHLAYLGPLYEEVLKSDTYAKGKGSTVARVIDGTVFGYNNTAISGVANVGNDTNWTGSHFNQANWYVYGRMAWDPDASAADIADEWARQTFSNDPAVVTKVTAMMMSSRESLVNYMTPLGLAHQMGTTDHYGPAPWVNDQSQADWNPAYYNKADATGIGFDRSATGSNAVAQYAAPVGDQFASKATVPDVFLLFFQRMGWDEPLASSGRSVWEELVYRYSSGVDAVQTLRDSWATVEGRIDSKRFKEVTDFLQTQHYEARWWRDASLQYFASVSKHTIPTGYAAPAHDLAFYKNLVSKCPSDVTKPRCPDVYTGNPSPAILK